VRTPVALALQGGGSWGAYTWGVLDALLACRHIDIAQLSGTSAGAINAAIVAGALANGGRAEARRALRSFWLSITQPALADFGGEAWGPIERHWREAIADWLITHPGVSPYSANPLGLNPLREVLEKHVDFEAIRRPGAPALYVTVTHVRTGLPQIFSNAAMSVDVLLASACLPEVFQAVEIDGEAYWDGGYCANPTLWPLFEGRAARDLIIVQLAPDTAAEVPRDAPAIRRRVGEIVFHASLVAALQGIAALRTVAAKARIKSGILDMRLHRIGPPALERHAHGSAMERSRGWIKHLEQDGRTAARRFLARHRNDIGHRETLDIGKVFGETAQPVPVTPANQPDYAEPLAIG
jgi:NTE family protein